MQLSRNWAFLLIFSGFIAASGAGRASSCTSQAEMNAVDRNSLAASAQKLAIAVIQQDTSTVQAALLPAVAQQWEGIRGVIEQGAGDVKGGHPQLNNMYLLDNTGQTGTGEAQFFCSNPDGSMTVTITLGSLPPGRFGVVQAYVMGGAAAGATQSIVGQLVFILGEENGAWKIGGVFLRPGMLGGHDGVWYWERAREAARSNSPWAAYFGYQAARYLLLPVDFISSPNLEKLDQEQAQIKGAPQFPYSVTAGDRTWKIDGVRFDPALHEPDLGVTYETTGVTDPAAQKTEAIAVLGALLKAQPAVRTAFHGLWAYASTNGRVAPVMELPMEKIP